MAMPQPPPPPPSARRDGPPPLPSRARRPEPRPLHAYRTEEILDPGELDRFKNLLLFAQSLVEGIFAGRHRSPLPGSSSEFRDHRVYTPGDPPEKLDWRAYGRTRRLFIRRYEDETDMVAHLLVDTSASMRYAGRGRRAKYLHAARLAAALACMMIRQGDKAALGLFSDTLRHWSPPGGTRRHLHDLVTVLERVRPDEGTGIVGALDQCAGVFKKRGRLVVLSDLAVEVEPLFQALSRYVHRGYQILLLQVLDPDELELPAASVARYVDMESGEHVEVDTEELRAGYRERMRGHIADIAREAVARGIEHRVVDTAKPYTAALEACLALRGRGGR